MSNTQARPSAVSAEALDAFFREAFPGRRGMPRHVHAEQDRVLIELDCTEKHLRPPDFINGPTQMAMADHAAYAAVFTRVGITPMALTSSLNINFLRPCRGKVLIVRAEVIKFGRVSVVVDVRLYGDGSDKLASQASVTYVLPTDRSSG